MASNISRAERVALVVNSLAAAAAVLVSGIAVANTQSSRPDPPRTGLVVTVNQRSAGVGFAPRTFEVSVTSQNVGESSVRGCRSYLAVRLIGETTEKRLVEAPTFTVEPGGSHTYVQYLTQAESDMWDEPGHVRGVSAWADCPTYGVRSEFVTQRLQSDEERAETFKPNQDFLKDRQ